MLGVVVRLCAGPQVAIWDIPKGGDAAGWTNRAAWKVVPPDPFALEVDPSKAASDPGYYGRDYSFEGDAALESAGLVATFTASRATVSVYAKSIGSGLRHVADVVLIGAVSTPVDARIEVVRNIGDQAALKAQFAADGASVAARFSIDRRGVLEITPIAGLRTVRLRTAIEFGVAPNPVGDDLIFGPTGAAGPDTLAALADHWFVGLCHGEDALWVMTWPGEAQGLRLNRGAEAAGCRPIETVDIDTAGQSLFLGAIAAPGVWRHETLNAALLEKDALLDWKPPFPARWKTQLEEAGVRTTFAFHSTKAEIWRGVPGDYMYPVWWDGSAAYFHLSKRVPPRGDAVIYFLEGQETPAGISTPVEILQSTLGSVASDPILDIDGRKLRTHHRRGALGVRRACTCGCTEAIQAFFERHEETGRRAEIAGALDDMIYFVDGHLARIDEYRHFALDLVGHLKEQQAANPTLKSYLGNLEQIAARIPQEYEVQKENMKSREYAAGLKAQTLALTTREDPKNLAAYMDLLEKWRGMGGAQDYLVAQCHAITRQLLQEAGYSAAVEPDALGAAKAIRKRCQAILRNPDGYEIWPNY